MTGNAQCCATAACTSIRNTQKEAPPRRSAPRGCILPALNSYLLPVEQLLEIIFTFFTLNVSEEDDPMLPEAEAPAPLAPAEADPPAEGEVLLPLGLEELALEEPLPSEPVIRTWCPTWSVSLEVSPAS